MAWLPYTQTLHLPVSLSGFGILTVSRISYLCDYRLKSITSLFRPDIWLDRDARLCASVHAARGDASVTDVEWTGCAIVEAPHDYGVSDGGALFAGISSGSASYTYNSYYMVTARQSEVGVIANTTITANGLESWRDPTVQRPPSVETIGGREVQWIYQPFSSIDGSIAFADGTLSPASSGATNPAGEFFRVAARSVDWARGPGWDPNSVGGDADFRLLVHADSSVTAEGSQTLADLTAGYRWRISASNAEGVPTDPGYAVLDGDRDSYASLVPLVTVRRHGLRRPAQGLTPPLHQRAYPHWHHAQGTRPRGHARGIY